MTNSNLTAETDERANKMLRLFHASSVIVESLNVMRFRVYCYWHGRLSLLWFSNNNKKPKAATANHELETTEMFVLHQICQAIKFIASIDR